MYKDLKSFFQAFLAERVFEITSKWHGKRKAWTSSVEVFLSYGNVVGTRYRKVRLIA